MDGNGLITRASADLPIGVGNFAVDSLDGNTDWQDVLMGCEVVVHLAARVHVMADVAYFIEHYEAKRAEWRKKLAGWKASGKKVVLWGGGSKGVAFLTTLGLTLDDVEYAVDINPIKTGTFMAGTGQEIIAPAFLQQYRPDVVVIMNPVYRAEITSDLTEMGLSPVIETM